MKKKGDTIEQVQIMEINIPENIPTFEDPKTGVKSAAFTFSFPSGDNGFLVVTKLRKGAWEVSNDIKKITIEFE